MKIKLSEIEMSFTEEEMKDYLKNKGYKIEKESITIKVVNPNLNGDDQIINCPGIFSALKPGEEKSFDNELLKVFTRELADQKKREILYAKSSKFLKLIPKFLHRYL